MNVAAIADHIDDPISRPHPSPSSAESPWRVPHAALAIRAAKGSGGVSRMSERRHWSRGGSERCGEAEVGWRWKERDGKGISTVFWIGDVFEFSTVHRNSARSSFPPDPAERSCHEATTSWLALILLQWHSYNEEYNSIIYRYIYIIYNYIQIHMIIYSHYISSNTLYGVVYPWGTCIRWCWICNEYLDISGYPAPTYVSK